VQILRFFQLFFIQLSRTEMSSLIMHAVHHFGQAEGHRKQGKPRMQWPDSIKKATGLRLEDLREAEQDRKKWRTLVAEKDWE
jgi:hypothetical protein